jgi:hypothetical protein
MTLKTDSKWFLIFLIIQLKERYEEVKKSLIEKFKLVDRVAITTDGWQRKYTAQKYETVTAHYRDPATETLQVVVLDTLIFKVRYSIIFEYFFVEINLKLKNIYR